MPRSDPFLARLLALLVPLGPVEARRLFGGHGLYLEGTIFALVYDGALFLKADDETKADFTRRGLGAISYEGGRGQTIALPYWQAPPELLADGKMLCRWAARAYEAGLRFNAKKKPRRAKPRAAERSGRRGPRFEPDF